MKRCCMVLAVMVGGFFSVGCIPGQLKEDLTAYMVNDLIPKGTEALKKEGAKIIAAGETALVAKGEEYLLKRVEKDMEQLDAQLALVGEVDPDTGQVIAKTWRDFDADRSDALDAKERAAAAFYVGKKAVLKGDFGLAGQAGTGAAGGIATIAALEFVRRRRKKKNGGAAPPSEDPAPPA